MVMITIMAMMMMMLIILMIDDDGYGDSDDDDIDINIDYDDSSSNDVDDLQVGRALGVMGPTGRWRNNLINKCLSSTKPLDKVVDDVTIAPVVRQLLQVN